MRELTQRTPPLEDGSIRIQYSVQEANDTNPDGRKYVLLPIQTNSPGINTLGSAPDFFY